MEPIFRFNLGDRVKDVISGLTGITMSRSESLYGCNRYWVSPEGTKDGKPLDGCWFDEDMLSLIDEQAIKRRRYRVYEDDKAASPIRRAGGPSSQPASQSGPSDR